MSRPYRAREPNRLRKQKFSAKSIFHPNRESNTRKISPRDSRDLASGPISSVIPEKLFKHKCKEYGIFKSFGTKLTVLTSFSHPSQPFAPPWSRFCPSDTKIRTLWHIDLIMTGFRPDGRRSATKKCPSYFWRVDVVVAQCRSYFARHPRVTNETLSYVRSNYSRHIPPARSPAALNARFEILDPPRFLPPFRTTDAR